MPSPRRQELLENATTQISSMRAHRSDRALRVKEQAVQKEMHTAPRVVLCQGQAKSSKCARLLRASQDAQALSLHPGVYVCVCVYTHTHARRG
jgi:predicted house-cleaning NTP pyrophosphatase (Maf/HAM1 superfamily)